MLSIHPLARGAALLALFFCVPLAATDAGTGPDAGPASRFIALFPAAAEPALHEAGIPVWDREEGMVIAGPTGTQLDALMALDITPSYRVADRGEGIHILSHDQYFAPPVLPGLPRFVINDGAVLYLVPAGLQMELPGLKLHGLFHGVPRVPLAPVRMHPADVAALANPPEPQAPNPLVQTIVNATSQASWFQFVRELSADADVTIPGFCTNCRIRTRASNYMFPLNNTGSPLGNPFATEYLEMKAAGWGFGGANTVRESYTSTDSGCTARQGALVWQNVIFTLPGQVDYAQNQQVIFLVHYDTISESAANDANNAPGADDAISGGVALLEAMRLFKDYGWKYPVKFLWVTGEEVGLCGSTAYTRQHSMAPVWRVLNMDQTAYDGNKNGLMNLYNWSVAACPACVAFGDAFVQANADYGNIIAPAKIVRNTVKMCQTDHCPFWNAGAVAIDLNEDLTNNDICPCFDSSQTASCRDTVTQFYPLASTTLMFDQNYSWPTEKAAIALIAHTAEPLYACPGSGATLAATAQSTQATLSWGAVSPVTNYVIERAPGGCGGPFTGVGSVTGTGFVNTGLTNNTTYGYRIRTCPFQVSNCVAVTPQACTAPGAPAIGAATVPGNNQIRVSWTNGAPASAQFNVYRATGTCAAPGPYARIATGVAASPYLDTTVSGGTTYAYQVAGTEATGLCESTKTACVQATATGSCTLAPTFAGAASVTNAAQSTCTLNVNWAAGTKNCPAASNTLTYKIFRSTASGTQGPQIASGVTGTSYSDTAGLTNGATYYYTAHAVDSLGNEDANSVQRSSAPTGAGGGTTTYTSTDVPKAIPDNNPAGVTSNLVVSGNANLITDVNVTMSATHTWDGDLTFSLIAPTAAAVTLSAAHGGSGDNYTGTVLDDAAATAISAGAPPFTGTFRPDAALTAVNGLPANGTWMLKAVDSAGADTGNITGWSLAITTIASCSTGCSATPMSSAVLHAKSGGNLVENWAAVAGAVTYNVYRNPSANVGTWTGPGVATGLTGLTWTDANQLGNTTSQFYSVTDVNGCGAESPK